MRPHRHAGCRGCVRHPHRDQHPPGAAREADRRHAQLGLAHRRHQRGDSRRAKAGERRGLHDGPDVVGPPVPRHRHRRRRGIGGPASADLLRRGPGHRVAHRRRRPRRSLRGDAAEARDQAVVGHRRGHQEFRRALLLPSLQGHQRNMHGGGRQQRERLTAARVDLQALRPPRHCGRGQSGHGPLG